MIKRLNLLDKNPTVNNHIIFQMIVDRTSWITQPNDKTSVIYQLDVQLLVPLYVINNIFLEQAAVTGFVLA